MPTDYIINTEHKVVFSYGWGILAFADFKMHRARLLQDPNFNAAFAQVALVSDVADVVLSNEEIVGLASVALFAANSPRAIVATLPLHFGLSRMFEAYADRQLIRVFRSLDEAVTWANVAKDLATEAFDKLRRAHDLS